MQHAKSLRKYWPVVVFSLSFATAFPALGGIQQASLTKGSHEAGCGDAQPGTTLADIQDIQQRIIRAGPPPVWIKIMPSRYMELHEALVAYEQTGVPLVAFDGRNFIAAGFSDDQGIYYFIPRLAHLLGLTLAKAIDIFFGALAIGSFFLGIIGFFLLFSNWLARGVALIGLFLLLLLSLWAGDVYSVQSGIVVAIVPWFLYLAQKKTTNLLWFAAFVFLAGLSIGLANAIRSHAGTTVMIFMLFVIAFDLRRTRRLKLALLTPLFAGLIIATGYFHMLRAQRDNYLQAAASNQIRPTEQHVFWHAVYIGFGFLSNDYVPAYRDEVAADKVHSISRTAGYLSPEYEQILRREVFLLVKGHPGFIILTLCAKLGVIGFFLLFAGNLGLLAAAFYPKNWAVELAFWSAIIFSSLFGLFVVPNPKYLLGFIAFAALYGMASIGHAINSGALGRMGHGYKSTL